MNDYFETKHCKIPIKISQVHKLFIWCNKTLPTTECSELRAIKHRKLSDKHNTLIDPAKRYKTSHSHHFNFRFISYS